MKILALALISLTSFAAELNVAGTFSYPHQIAFFSYADQSACEGDQGKWDDGLCFFDAEDTVEVAAAADGKFNVKVDTITTNAHMCSFEAEGVIQGNGIVASAESEIWDGDKSVPATCVVTTSYVDGNTVNVTTNGEACNYFCGANASLAIEGATRK